MSKAAVVFFSGTGNTEATADVIVSALGADKIEAEHTCAAKGGARGDCGRRLCVGRSAQILQPIDHFWFSRRRCPPVVQGIYCNARESAL